MKSKGFTLIELLAVLIILGIVALIATPIILDVIGNTNDSSLEISVKSYIGAIDKTILGNEISGNTEDGVYYVMHNGDLCNVELENEICAGDILKIDTDGLEPTSGVITIENGKVVDYTDLYIKETYVSKNNN